MCGVFSIDLKLQSHVKQIFKSNYTFCIIDPRFRQRLDQTFELLTNPSGPSIKFSSLRTHGGS